jgi:O-acetylhomoserine (thiol)-lyase
MGFTTQLLHSDRRNGVEHGNLLKPIHPGVTYGYEDAHDLARVFQGKQKGYTYGRQINPTVEALEQKITQMENGLATIAFSTGMAAIGTTLFALLRSGDHVIASKYLFGNTASLFESFAAHGIELTFVDATCADAVAAAVQSNTKLVFVETIANPRTQVSDLVGIGAVCKAQGLIYVVDNTLTTPFLFQPKSVGACLVINSLTKYIGGHGNALGGSVTEMGQFDWTTFANIHDGYRVGEPSMWGLNQIKKKGLRDFGASLAADSAHRLSTGADTLALRMPRACDNASALAAFFQDHDLIDAVYYPGLLDHPQHQRTARLFGRPGAILSIELQPRIDCFRFLNQLQTVIKATHLGDIRTLAIPVAHSIFYEIGPARRAEMDIKDNLIRFSVGIEEIEDLLDDFDQALSSQR